MCNSVETPPQMMSVEDVIEKIMEFSDWVECKCGECRVDGNSHAVNQWASLLALAKHVTGREPCCGK